MSSQKRIGVIVAAGRGRRMGSTKQLVPWPTADGEKPLVASAFDAIRPACDEMIVVVGHEASAVVAALGERPFHTVAANADAPMFASIRAGLIAAQSLDSAATVVLQPGDQPQLTPSTVTLLATAAQQRPDQAVIPQYRGQGGHPVLIPPTITSCLISAECPTGLGDFWLANPELCHRVQVEDACVLLDIDTQAELRD